MSNNEDYNQKAIHFMGEVAAELRNVNASLAELKAASNMLHNDLDNVRKSLAVTENNLSALHTRVDDISEKVVEHEKLKNKAFGILTAISIAWGAFVAGLSYWVQKIF